VPTRAELGGSLWPRGVSAVVGIWVFLSSFLWSHTSSAATNTWILGVLIAAASVWAMYRPPVRYLTTMFALWLFFASIALPHQVVGTLWSNLISAIVVFVMSLVPTEPIATTRGHQPRAA